MDIEDLLRARRRRKLIKLQKDLERMAATVTCECLTCRRWLWMPSDTMMYDVVEEFRRSFKKYRDLLGYGKEYQSYLRALEEIIPIQDQLKTSKCQRLKSIRANMILKYKIQCQKHGERDLILRKRSLVMKLPVFPFEIRKEICHWLS